MMKFVFMILAGGGLFFLKKDFFWLVNGVLMMIYYVFVKEGVTFMDYSWSSMFLGFDTIAYSLMILSLLISVYMNLASQGLVENSGANYFYMCVYVLLFVLVLTFSVGSLLLFFFFFEFSLIPTLLIIMGWGYQPERLQAGIYFLFYTMFASLPLLLVLFFNLGSLGLVNVFIKDYFFCWFNLFLFIFSILAFLIKLPMFFFHLWLPKAHVEAPVGGSMVLAGILLKLGGYGIYRVIDYSKMILIDLGGYFLGLSVAGMIFVGFMCCRLNDLKALVAYSSVAHMGMVIGGLMSFNYWGFEGMFLMMIGHGLASSGLFCAVNIFYERSGSRLFMINKGVVTLFPIFSLLFFLLCGANMASPPTLNLLSEIFLISSLLGYTQLVLLALPLGCYLSAVFTLFLFSYTQHGSNYLGVNFYKKSLFREFHVLWLHLLPLNFIFLNIDYYLLM